MYVWHTFNNGQVMILQNHLFTCLCEY